MMIQANKGTRFWLAVFGFIGHLGMIVYILERFKSLAPESVLVALVWASAFDIAVYIGGRTLRPARYIEKKIEKEIEND